MEYTKTDLQNYSKYLIEVAERQRFTNLTTFSLLKNYVDRFKFWNNLEEKSINEDLEILNIIFTNFKESYSIQVDSIDNWLESKKWKLIV